MHGPGHAAILASKEAFTESTSDHVNTLIQATVQSYRAVENGP